MPREFDVIVIGGGPAGATVAAYMARWGHRVLLAERDRFPRYHLGESLLPSTIAVLDDLGLLEAMEAAGFPRKLGGTFTWGGWAAPWTMRFSDNPWLPAPYGYHVDRARFDAILLDRARELGAEVLQPCEITDILIEEGGVVGATWRHRETGEEGEAQARFVVDASGTASELGSRLTLRRYDQEMRQTAVHAYYAGVAGPPAGQEGHVVVETTPIGWFWAIPLAGTELGELSVGLVCGPEHRPALAEAGPEAFLDAALAQAPRIREMLGPAAERRGPVRTTQDWAFACSRMAGPGFFLCGDAAAFVDPLLSSGVTLAMLSAYAAAVCMNTILGDPTLEQPALEFYDANYKHMVRVVRDCLLAFYADRGTSGEGVFSRARELMNLGEAASSEQALSFLANTLAGNPHPTARHQIERFLRRFGGTDASPTPDATRLLGGLPLAELADTTPLVVTGQLAEGFIIDDAAGCLRRTWGIERGPLPTGEGSSAAWLLGRSFTPAEDQQLEVLGLIERHVTWGRVLEVGAARRGVSPRALRAHFLPILQGLVDEGLVVLRPADANQRWASAHP